MNRDGKADFHPYVLAEWTGSRDFAVAQPYHPGTTTRVGNGFLTNGFTGLPLVPGTVIGPNPSTGIWMEDRDDRHQFL
jgi:hypothetical protein